MSRPAVKSALEEKAAASKHQIIATLGFRSLKFEERCKEW